MPTSRFPLRLVLLAILVIAVTVLIGLAVSLVNSLLEFQERLAQLPLLVRLPLIALTAAAVIGLVFVGWKLLRPARSARKSGAR
jgi:hypothetical protein